jgi:hypothetical protein
MTMDVSHTELQRAEGRLRDGVRGCLSTLRVRLSPNLPSEAEFLRSISPCPEFMSIASDWFAFEVWGRAPASRIFFSSVCDIPCQCG